MPSRSGDEKTVITRHGHLTAPEHHLDFVQRFRWQSAQQPQATAFVYLLDGEDRQHRLSYSELDRQARAVAVSLTRAGLAGERILLLYPPGLDFIIGLLGCFYAGAVAVPAYPPRRNRNVERLQAISADAGAAAALSVQEVVSRFGRFLSETPELKSIKWIATDVIDKASAHCWQAPPIDPGSLAVLQYTSGSTGMPKGVMLTHANLMHNCSLITRAFSAQPSDRGLSWLPAYHDMGLVGGILNPVFIGGSSILLSPMAFLQKPSRWLRAISKFGVTISGAPSFAYDVCTKKIAPEEVADCDLSGWTLAFNGAEPVRASTLEHFAEKFAALGFRAGSILPLLRPGRVDVDDQRWSAAYESRATTFRRPRPGSSLGPRGRSGSPPGATACQLRAGAARRDFADRRS